MKRKSNMSPTSLVVAHNSRLETRTYSRITYKREDNINLGHNSSIYRMEQVSHLHKCSNRLLTLRAILLTIWCRIWLPIRPTCPSSINRVHWPWWGDTPKTTRCLSTCSRATELTSPIVSSQCKTIEISHFLILKVSKTKKWQCLRIVRQLT